MNCPTCFRKLLVPNAPASGEQSFVLTATEVANRPVSARDQGPPAIGRIAPKPTVTLFTILAVVFLAGIAVGVVIIGKRMFNRPAPVVPVPPPPPPIVTNKPVAAPPPPLPLTTNWTLNLAEAKIPDAPVQGLLHGSEFKLDRAVIQAGRLDLRQGDQWPPDLGVSIHLFAPRAEALAGRTVLLDVTRTNGPRVILRWKEKQEHAIMMEFRWGYAARVEFGGVVSNHLSGKIYLAIPDGMKSYVAGTFYAEIRKPNQK